jgi:intraflagellar transport protein 80
VTQRRLRVLDVASESSEEIEVAKDRVVEVAIGYDHLIVATSNQCYVYTLQNLNTPIIFELKAPPLFLHLCRKYFLSLDLVAGLSIFSFEGRLLCSPRHQNFRPEFLRKELVSLSSELVAMVDTADPRLVQLFDMSSSAGKFLLKVTHSSEVITIALSQSAFSGAVDRYVAFLDAQRDLYLCAPFATTGMTMVKLQPQVDSFLFHDDMCACASITSDGHMCLWYHPESAFVDSDLLSACCVKEDGVDYGRNALLVSFSGCRVSLRKVDGALVYASSSPEAPLLDEFLRNSRWEEASRLCRLSGSVFLWATLAAQSVNKRQLEVAETAYAVLNDIPKVEFLQRLQSQSSEDVRQAELLLFKGLPDEAERLMLQANPSLAMQAIRLNVELFRWSRALELALKHRYLVEAVLAHRQQYLDEFGQNEHDPKFLQALSQYQFDLNSVLNENPLEIAVNVPERSNARRK